MQQLFISDLHLEENRPPITKIFLHFLLNQQQEKSTLYILGDFFETWIGDDDASPFHDDIIQALKNAVQHGLSIYIMHGNRDFLLGKKFFRQTGCILLPDEYVVTINGTPTLLMHGDTLCTQDKKYLAFRKKARHWFFQKLFLLKSLKKRKAIAEYYRAASKQHTSTTPDYIMDVTQSEVENKMQQHGVQHVIHGHTHRPFEHHFTLNNLPATRTVLAAWHEHGSVLVCDGTEKKEIVLGHHPNATSAGV